MDDSDGSALRFKSPLYSRTMLTTADLLDLPDRARQQTIQRPPTPESTEKRRGLLSDLNLEGVDMAR